MRTAESTGRKDAFNARVYVCVAVDEIDSEGKFETMPLY